MNTANKYQKVVDLADLIDLINSGKNDFYITLGGGLVSSKYIEYDAETEDFSIFHSIDGHFQNYTHDELMKESNIGIALEKGALFVDNR